MHSIYLFHPFIQFPPLVAEHLRAFKESFSGTGKKFRLICGGIFTNDFCVCFFFPRTTDILVLFLEKRFIVPLNRALFKIRNTLFYGPEIQHVRKLMYGHIIIVASILHPLLGPIPALANLSAVGAGIACNPVFFFHRIQISREKSEFFEMRIILLGAARDQKTSLTSHTHLLELFVWSRPRPMAPFPLDLFNKPRDEFLNNQGQILRKAPVDSHIFLEDIAPTRFIPRWDWCKM